MVSSLISYVGEPLYAACRLAGMGVVKCRGMENCFPPPMPIEEARYRLSKFDNYTWPNGFIAKMEAFIVEMGLDPKFIILEVSEKKSPPCTTVKSIKLHGYAKLLLSEKMINEIAVKFTDEHQFIIAHELGRIFHDDFGAGQMRKITIESASSLAAYAVTAAAFSPLSCAGMAATHLIACGVAKFGSWWVTNLEQQRQVFAADHFAASKSIKLAQGGTVYFEREQRKNQLAVAICTKINGERIKKEKNCCVRWTFRVIIPKLFRCIVSKEGDDNLDFKYPPYSVRKAVIASIINTSFLPDDKSYIPAN